MDNANVLPISKTYEQIGLLRQSIEQQILGQENLVTKLLVVLLADGHLLVEGAPGLAKTKAVKALADAIEGNFHRVQFTPDLLPGDLTGTEVYRPADGSFSFQPGPIFNNLVLADEINRAPAKVQSALLEAMAERQVTIGKQTYQLPPLFLVMATQNPIEQEGTYPLPEAQLDRFLMYVKIAYPTENTELQILKLARQEAQVKEVPNKLPHISQQEIFAARKEVANVHISEALEQYIVDLILATRNPQQYSTTLPNQIRFGASPRATIALDRCAKAHAWLHQRDYVAPQDIHAVAYDILRHRLILSFEAEAQGVSCDDVIGQILDLVAIP
jgi:MoxR-like ATPase